MAIADGSGEPHGDFYDSIYTERFMRYSSGKPSGYDENSPFNYQNFLKGNYLLRFTGSAMITLHVQNTMRMVEALVQANKQFDWAIYPIKKHSIQGGNTRIHLYTKNDQFYKRTIYKIILMADNR